MCFSYLTLALAPDFSSKAFIDHIKTQIQIKGLRAGVCVQGKSVSDSKSVQGCQLTPLRVRASCPKAPQQWTNAVCVCVCARNFHQGCWHGRGGEGGVRGSSVGTVCAAGLSECPWPLATTLMPFARACEPEAGEFVSVQNWGTS